MGVAYCTPTALVEWTPFYQVFCSYCHITERCSPCNPRKSPAQIKIRNEITIALFVYILLWGLNTTHQSMIKERKEDTRPAITITSMTSPIEKKMKKGNGRRSLRRRRTGGGGVEEASWPRSYLARSWLREKVLSWGNPLVSQSAPSQGPRENRRKDCYC